MQILLDMPMFGQELTSGGQSAVALVLMMIVCLLVCLAGYLLYRLVLVVSGLQAGVVLGAMLLERYVPQPSGLDYFVICTCAGILLALISWYLYRLMFAGLILLGSGLAIWIRADMGSPTWQAVVIGFVGLIVAILAFIYLKRIFIFLTSLAGGLGVALFSAALITRQSIALDFYNPQQHGWAAPIVTIAAGLVLTVLGIISQSKLSSVFRSSLAPNAGKGSRGGSSSTKSMSPRISGR